MKRLSTICMAALLLMAVSCKKDKQTEVENAGSGFRATVESHAGDSKTHLADKAVIWDGGDAILVKSSTSTPMPFTTADGGASVIFEATETLPEDFYTPDYTGYYPADAFDLDQLTLLGTQTYAENSFAAGANPMVAKSSSTELSFKNVCGLLKLELYSATACNVANITLTSSKSDEMLWGTGNVVLTEGIEGIPSLEGLSNGSNALTLNCNGTAMSVESANPSSYFFVVPANTLSSGFTVKVTDTDGKTWTKTTSQNTTISRNQITKMPSLQVETSAPVYVNFHLPSGLVWATCNVGASSPEEYGYYFQWGATTPLDPTDNANWSICPFNNGSSMFDFMYFNQEVKDQLCPGNVLAPAYDAARASWGGDWRMPTAAEWQELYDNTDHEWTTQGGVNGCLFTGKGQDVGVTLFFPAAGCHYGENIIDQGENGCYWSSSLNANSDMGAHLSSFNNSNFTPAPDDWRMRTGGYSVRPVRPAATR